MKRDDVCTVTVPDSDTFSRLLMDEEIKGTTVYAHGIKAGEMLGFSALENSVRIIILNFGTVIVSCGNDQQELSGLTVYIGNVGESQCVTARSGSNFIELIRKLDASEMADIKSEVLPYVMPYNKAAKYHEDCKSAQTTSRMLVPPRIIPRFAMGSVETRGDDMVEKHSHPVLDQFFYGLSDNNCLALIDDISVPFGGNTLLHIPLGSDHGILSKGANIVHYLWMDFLFDEESLKYMDDAHTIINE